MRFDVARPAIFRLCMRVACGGLMFLVLLGTTVPSAQAQTVQDIQNRKKISIGVILDFPPFGMLNTQQQPDGFDVEFAQRIGKYLGVTVDIVPVESANRIPELVTKRIDVLVASLGITPERAQQVMFTIPYAATQIDIIAPKRVAITGMEDLVGKKVGVGRGTSGDIFLTPVAPKGTTIMRFEGDGAAAQALLSGQVDALVYTNTEIAELVKSAPDLQIETKLVLKTQANAIAVRKDALELRQWLDTLIYYMKATGELDALYRKWLGEPLPPLPVF
jgi:polar amino acid transport system substrate-binding protein